MHGTQYRVPLFRPFIPDGLSRSLLSVLDSGWIGEGPQVKKLENALAQFLDVKDVVCTNSCTSAITIALHLAGVGPGDEVISTPLTCVATNLPVLLCGAKIIWADIDPDTGNISSASVRNAVTDRTKAILVVHWGGYPCDLDALSEISHQYRIPLIEDAAHALGSTYKGRRLGNHGDFVCFSFQSVKLITTGDGGALVCRDPTNISSARQLRWFGIDREKRYASGIDSYDITLLGSKYHMNDIAATIGLESILHVDRLLKTHCAHARCYREALVNVPGVRLIQSARWEGANNYLFTALFDNRDDLRRKMKEEGIESSPVHTRNDVYSVFSEARFSQRHVHLENFAARMLCLPIGYWVTEDDVHSICDLIRRGW